MTNIKDLPIHIFYTPEHPNGYTTATSNREACKVAVELMHRTGVPVSVTGGNKHWKTGKYAFWIVEVSQPFRSQTSGGYVVHGAIQ